MKKQIKIIVAMSGGVDSSVAAALLKQGGFNVVGIFMKFWKEGAGQNRCCSPESEKMARITAKKIGIPFYVINAEKEFKKAVVDYFLKEYKTGNTPNPCVVCNKEIKFGLLVKKALSLGADYVATGHYARRSIVAFPLALAAPARGSLNSRQFFAEHAGSANHAKLPCEVRSKATISLFSGADMQKDQSYFLWQLNQKQLKHILFPVGNYTKAEVRKMAEKYGLPTAKAEESQEVCFVSQTNNDFLKKYLKTNPGDIIDEKGKILGHHPGLWFYTIGQRKGLGLPGGTKPYYVVAKNSKKNALLVSKNERDLLKKEFYVKNQNWISKIKLPAEVECKIRYKNKSFFVRVFENGKIVAKHAQKAVTSGQSAVFYKKGEVLGGGVIK